MGTESTAAVGVLLLVLSCAPRGSSHSPPRIPRPAAADQPVTPARGALALHVVAKSESPIEIHGVGEAALIALNRPLFLGFQDHFEAIADPPDRRLLHVGGTWPRVWATSTHGSLKIPHGDLLRWSPAGWQRVHLLPRGVRFLGIGSYRGGVIAIAEPEAEGEPSKILAFDQEPAVIPPQQELSTEPGCATRLTRPQMLTLDSGEVFLFGYGCGAREPTVERWDASGKHAIEALPRDASAEEETALTAFQAASATSVFVGGSHYNANSKRQRPWFARFDGKTWAMEPAPVTNAVEGMAVLRDGSLLVLGGAHDRMELRRRSQSGAWSALPLALPTQGTFRAYRMWASSMDNVWMIAEQLDAPGARLFLLLHSKPLEPIRA